MHGTQVRPPPARPCRSRPCRPCRAPRSSPPVLWILGKPCADHGIASYQFGKSVFAPTVSAGRSHRQDKKARLSSRIPDSDFRTGGKVHAKFGEHTTRVL